MSDLLFETLTTEIGKLLGPVRSAVENPRLIDRLLAEIGASAKTAGGDSLVTALRALVDLGNQLDALASRPSPSFEEIADVLDLSDKAFRAVRALSDAGGPAASLEGFGRDFANLLIEAYLSRWHPLAREFAALLTLLEPAGEQVPAPIILNGKLVRMPFSVDRFHLNRLSMLLHDPVGTLRDAYVVNDLQTIGDANAMADKLFPRLLRFLRLLQVPCRYGFRPGDESLLGDAAPLMDHALIIYVADMLAGASAEAGVVLTLSSADRGDLGLVLCPFGELSLKEQVANWDIELDFTAGVDAVAWGRRGVTLLAGPSTTEVSGRFLATLTAPDDGPAFIVGSPTGTRLEVGGTVIKAEMALSESHQTLALAADVSSSAIVIASGDTDSFLGSFLPSDGLRAKFDLGLGWSTERGLTFSGAAGLDAIIPVGITIGGLSVPTIYLALQESNAGVTAEISASVGLSIGPVDAVVDRVGISTVLSFPEKDANLGVVDLAVGFKPPAGVGLSIASLVVQGSGSLRYDAVLAQYAGSLGLRVRDRFDLNVAGLLTTRMPDGSAGYSLLLVGALSFPPVPVGFGFSLNKLGALVGIDRTTDADALTGALAAGNLDSVIFPANPAAMVSLPDALSKLFPIKKDAHTVGIMAGLSWGRASLAQIDLGFFYDTSSPTRIVAIGRLTVERPRITLRLLALGVLDFDRGEMDLQARLVESRILGVDLFGDAAIMLRWGQDPNFVLSIGGFHPDYHPPTEFTRRFPALRRVTLRAHTDESVLRLSFQAYLAITSNTVQMGARVDFGVSVSALSVDGMVSFDALIQIDPALFINVMVRGSVALKVAGVTIIGAKVAAQLIGPGNWYAAGTATITVLWWDLDFGFETGGDKPSAPSLPIIDGANLLAASLASKDNWSALATTQSRLISVRRPNAPGALLFHPLDDLTVRQPVVPLGVVVTQIEEGRLAVPRTFEVTVKVGGTKMDTEDVWDPFARAKYVDMSEAAKLSTPSFEPMVSGVRVVLDEAAAPAPSVNAGWSYDEFVWTAKSLQSSTLPPFVPDASTVAHALATSATAEAPLRRSGVARYRGPLAGQVTLKTGGPS